MKNYLSLLSRVLNEGEERPDRTGVGTLGIFGAQMRFDLSKGFPIVTTKKVHFKSVVHELIWFMRGDTNIKYLKDNGVSIWDEWADENGNLGPIYGKQWRNFGTTKSNGVDQLLAVWQTLKNDPYSRRHVVSAWNPMQINKMALPPCHVLFQFYVDAEKRLSCQLYQRSCDIFLGLPFNIASYALLTHLFAHTLGYGAGEFIWTGGDIHLYKNHIEQAKLQLERFPFELPTLVLKDKPFPALYEYSDIELQGYNCYPAIKAPIAV